ncbi:hypothetical protein CMK13_17550 [Candidatus Poribacteria bacterium]|nr:hypothetical protein [Candidatus Poribacteria bacterium]
MKMKRSPKAKSTVFDITETEDKVRQPPKLDRMTQLLKELRNIRKSIHSIEVSKKNSAKSEEILNTQFSALKDEIKEINEMQEKITESVSNLNLQYTEIKEDKGESHMPKPEALVNEISSLKDEFKQINDVQTKLTESVSDLVTGYQEITENIGNFQISQREALLNEVSSLKDEFKQINQSENTEVSQQLSLELEKELDDAVNENKKLEEEKERQKQDFDSELQKRDETIKDLTKENLDLAGKIDERGKMLKTAAARFKQLQDEIQNLKTKNNKQFKKII